MTEFPKEVFEKRGREGKKQLLKPVFSKRKERPRNPQGNFLFLHSLLYHLIYYTSSLFPMVV